MSSRSLRLIDIFVRRCPVINSRVLAAAIKRINGDSIHPRSVRRWLKKMGYRRSVMMRKPYLSERNRKIRRSWCQKYSHKSLRFWTRCIFSDEFSVVLHNPHRHCWRKVGERYLTQHLAPRFRQQEKVHFWGCFSFIGGTGPLIAVSKGGKMNSRWYKGVLEQVAEYIDERIPLSERHSVIFQDDNAPAHRASILNEAFEKLGVEHMDWPPYSPDISPIENVWGHIKHLCQGRVFRNRQDCITQITNLWNYEIPRSYFHSLIASMDQRIKRVLKNKGGHCKY